MSDFSYNTVTSKLVHRFSFELILLIFPVSDHFVVPQGWWVTRELTVFVSRETPKIMSHLFNNFYISALTLLTIKGLRMEMDYNLG